MNVLLLYTIEIFPYEQSWYSFYSQVFNFLKKKKKLKYKFAGCLFVSCIGGREKNF